MRIRLARPFAHALTIAAAVVLVSGGYAWGAGSFDDVPENHTHFANIEAIRAAGVTLGCTATSYCPAGNVSRGQMASLLARLGGLSYGTTDNFPKVNARSDAQSYCAVATANPGSYPSAPCGTVTTFVGEVSNVAGRIDMAIAANGLPIMTYYDGAADALKVTACKTPDCSMFATSTVDTSVAATTSQSSSIAIRPNGLPVISFFEADADDLRVAACTAPDCTGPITVTTLDSTGNVGGYNAIGVGPNGLPVIAYHRGNQGFDNIFDLKFAACTSADCTGTPTITTLDADGITGLEPSLTFGADGLPIVSYVHQDTLAIKVLLCVAADCTGTPLINTVITGAFDAAIATGTDGIPVFAVRQLNTDDLVFVTCANAACTGTATSVTVDAPNDVGRNPSLAIGLDGLPVITYFDNTNQDLRVARCSTRTCGGTPVLATVDAEGWTGEFSSIHMGLDGFPVAAYYSEGELKLARIGTASP